LRYRLQFVPLRPRADDHVRRGDRLGGVADAVATLVRGSTLAGADPRAADGALSERRARGRGHRVDFGARGGHSYPAAHALLVLETMLALLTSVDAWIALLTLTVLEIVLGIDNIIFLSLAANKLPPPRRPAARRIGLSLALVMRIIFLSSVAWIISLSRPIL